jgi:hypothetical protein
MNKAKPATDFAKKLQNARNQTEPDIGACRAVF